MVVKWHKPPKDICSNTLVRVSYTFSTPGFPLLCKLQLWENVRELSKVTILLTPLSRISIPGANSVSFPCNSYSYRLGVVYTLIRQIHRTADPDSLQNLCLLVPTTCQPLLGSLSMCFSPQDVRCNPPKSQELLFPNLLTLSVHVGAIM